MCVCETLTVQTLVTVLASSIVDALQTFPSGPVAVANSVEVHVAVALALLAVLLRSELASGIAEVAIRTDLAFRTWESDIKSTSRDYTR